MKKNKLKIGLHPSFYRILLVFIATIFILSASAFIAEQFNTNHSSTNDLTKTRNQINNLTKELESAKKSLVDLQNIDQVKTNQDLSLEIKNIQKSFNEAVTVYEDIIDLKIAKVNTQKIDDKFSEILKVLSQRKYTEADTKISEIKSLVKSERDKLAVSTVAAINTVNLPSSNIVPEGGYRRQQVTTDAGNFVIDILSADLGSTKVIIDTSSDGDCQNDCPVMSVGNYASRSGAFAAINGSYFCPASYPSCAEKKNSFDTLLMNKNKKYFNSDNNVYSTVPAAIFSSGSARFVSQSLQWGRDTGVDGVIANQPLLTLSGQLLFSGNSDAKQSSRSNRSFIGSSQSKIFMGVVYSSSVAEAAKVLHTLGIQNSLNLDSGGSTAFWVGGYKAGPGRDVPNAILFVKR